MQQQQQQMQQFIQQQSQQQQTQFEMLRSVLLAQSAGKASDPAQNITAAVPSGLVVSSGPSLQQNQQFSPPQPQQQQFQSRQQPTGQSPNWFRGNRNCFVCNSPEHYARDCPANVNGNQRTNENVNAAAASSTANNRRVIPVRTAYLRVRIGGQACSCLLDTGSEVSILPARFITTEIINPNTTQTLTAANGSEIELLGEARVNIELEPGFVVSTLFLVSEYVDEAMLGLDWLTEMQADWQFARRTVTIYGRVYKLLASRPTWKIRRVVLQEAAIIPAHTNDGKMQNGLFAA